MNTMHLTQESECFAAAQAVASTCEEALEDVATSFTCHEAEQIARLLRLAGSLEQANRFLWFHGQDDTEDSGDNPNHIALASNPQP